MKRLYVLLLVMSFIVLLSGCSAFEEKYSPPITEELTEEDVRDIIEEEVGYSMDLVFEGTELMLEEYETFIQALMVYIEVLNSYERMNSKVYHSDLDIEKEKLREEGREYLVENFPDYFTMEDFDFPQEYYETEYMGFSLKVEYTSYMFIVLIDSMELCNLDTGICETQDTSTQKEFVMSIEEFEWKMEQTLQEILTIIQKN